MTQIPEAPAATQEDLALWYQMHQQLAKLKAAEMLLRQRIFKSYFPEPKEGTNTLILPDTFQLKAVHVINRKIVEESMQALCHRPQLEEGVYGPSKLEEAGVRPDMIIKWKPELALAVYRELTETQRHVVDQMLMIDNGSPQLKIEPPKAPRKGKAKPDDIPPQEGEKIE
jgi:hypothetical protein